MVSHLMVPWQPTTRGGGPGPDRGRKRRLGCPMNVDACRIGRNPLESQVGAFVGAAGSGRLPFKQGG